jgi:serine/threonine-protein kinase
MAGAGRGAELSMLTDPSGFRVREPGPEDQRATDDLAPATALEPRPGTVLERRPGKRRKGARTLAAVATAGCVAAVGLSAITFAGRQPAGMVPDVADSTDSTTMSTSEQARPGKSRTRTRRPPVIPAKSPRPIPSRSATVGTSATPTKKPTPKPTPTTRTPTPTRTPTHTTTPTISKTPTPTASPDPGETNPPKEET